MPPVVAAAASTELDALHRSIDQLAGQVEGHVIPTLSRVGGFVQDVNARENQPVAAGQVLVQLDDREFAAEPLRVGTGTLRTQNWGWNKAGALPSYRDGGIQNLIILAFGDSITLSHVLRQRARAGEFLMSDAVMGALSVENLDLDAEPLPPMEMPRRQPLRIYGVLLEGRLDFT